MANLELLDAYKRVEVNTILEHEYKEIPKEVFIDNRNRYSVICTRISTQHKHYNYASIDYCKAYFDSNKEAINRTGIYNYMTCKASVLVIGEDDRLVSTYIATVYIGVANASYLVIDHDGKVIISTKKYRKYHVNAFTNEPTTIKITRYKYVSKLLTKHNKYFKNVNIPKPVPSNTIAYILRRYYAKYIRGDISIECNIDKTNYSSTYENMLYDSGWVIDDDMEKLLELISNDTRDYSYCSIISSFSNIKIDTYKTTDNTSKYWNICNVSVPLLAQCTKQDVMKYQNDIMSLVYWCLRRKVAEIKERPEILDYLKPTDIILTIDKILIIKFGYKGDTKEQE